MPITIRFFPALAALIIAAPVPVALADGRLVECNARASAGNLVEPWSENSRSYAEGAVRVAKLRDDDAPECCRRYLLVLAPSGAQAPESARQCLVVGGFQYLDIGGILASYSPHIGLTLSVPVWRSMDRGAPDAEPFPDRIKLLINQETGTISLE